MPARCTCLSPQPGQHSAVHWLSHPPVSTGTPGWWLHTPSACAPSSQSPEGPGRSTAQHKSGDMLLTTCHNEQHASGMIRHLLVMLGGTSRVSQALADSSAGRASCAGLAEPLSEGDKLPAPPLPLIPSFPPPHNSAPLRPHDSNGRTPSTAES